MKNLAVNCIRGMSLFCLPLVLLVAQDGDANPDVQPWVGTWKLNIAKSKFTPGPPDQSFAITVAPDGSLTANGITADGKPIHWSHANGNGKQVPIEGMDGGTDVTVIRARTLDDTMTVNGKVVAKVHSVLSSDGRSSTSTGFMIDAQGHETRFVDVFDRQ